MDDVSQTAALRSPWHKNLWILGLSSAILYALSFPPADLWPLAWVALLPWLRLISLDELPKFSLQKSDSVRSERFLSRILRSIPTIPKRPYGIIYLCALVHWLMVLHWLRLPFWATGIAGFFLCAYCAAYIPIWIGLSRVAVHRWRLPMPLVVALVWMGLEYMRQWFLSGFAMACLAHTQYRFLSLIQIAEIGGATLVSGLILLPAAWLAEFLWIKNRSTTSKVLQFVFIATMFVLTFVHGNNSLSEEGKTNLLNDCVALVVQGNIDTTFDGSQATNADVFRQYHDLTIKGLREVAKEFPFWDNEGSRSDAVNILVIWPESMWRSPYITFADGVDPTKIDPNLRTTKQCQDEIANYVKRLSESSGGRQHICFIAGVNRIHFTEEDREKNESFNSAFCYNMSSGFDPQYGVYDKQHRVPFGEYILLDEWFSGLYKWMPFGQVAKGKSSALFKVSAPGSGFSGTVIRASPSICYESVMPQVSRANLLKKEADLLVNVTNDGWFWGSSELDLHLVCGVFRAIEARKPMFISANTGFSAAIDSCGRIIRQGQRHQTDYLYVKELYQYSPSRFHYYILGGEVPGIMGLIFCVILVAEKVLRERRERLRKLPNKDDERFSMA